LKLLITVKIYLKGNPVKTDIKINKSSKLNPTLNNIK